MYKFIFKNKLPNLTSFQQVCVCVHVRARARVHACVFHTLMYTVTSSLVVA
jgi:hypothetical protein